MCASSPRCSIQIVSTWVVRMGHVALGLVLFHMCFLGNCILVESWTCTSFKLSVQSRNPYFEERNASWHGGRSFEHFIWQRGEFLNCLLAVYADGQICLDILQNQWSPIYDISAILTSIQVNFLHPRCRFTGLQHFVIVVGFGIVYSTRGTQRENNQRVIALT